MTYKLKVIFNTYYKLFSFFWMLKERYNWKTLRDLENKKRVYLYLAYIPNCLKTENSNEMSSRFMEAFPL